MIRHWLGFCRALRSSKSCRNRLNSVKQFLDHSKAFQAIIGMRTAVAPLTDLAVLLWHRATRSTEECCLKNFVLTAIHRNTSRKELSCHRAWMLTQQFCTDSTFLADWIESRLRMHNVCQCATSAMYVLESDSSDIALSSLLNLCRLLSLLEMFFIVQYVSMDTARLASCPKLQSCRGSIRIV